MIVVNLNELNDRELFIFREELFYRNFSELDNNDTLQSICIARTTAKGLTMLINPEKKTFNAYSRVSKF